MHNVIHRALVFLCYLWSGHFFPLVLSKENGDCKKSDGKKQSNQKVFRVLQIHFIS